MCTNGLTAQAFAGRLPPTPSMRSVMVWIWTAVALLAAAPRVGLTQGNYPNRSIKIIVPIVPGTLPDTLARLIGDKLASKWGQAVIVENRGGASGNIGAEAVARSDPDGYTLLVSQPPPVAINQYLFAKLNFDPLAFAPVSIISTSPNVLVVHPKITANTIAELITYAKANPDALNYASTGVGGTPHLSTELFKSMTGIRASHVPYSRGLAPAITDLIAGRVDMMFTNITDVLQHIRSGALKAIGVGSDRPVPALSNVPPIGDTVPGFQSTTWIAVVAPPKTPSEIATKLSQTIVEALQLPDVIKRYHDMSITPVGTSPAETAVFLRNESERWRQVIASAKIKPE
jgi:tripartite-type tricarboxylate transporter receptor subunit TctC